MNLHSIVSGAIAAVNPHQPLTVSMSTGTTTNPDGTQIPTYSSVPVVGQIQALTFRDLQQVAGLNLNGTRRAIYLYGEIDGVVRSMQKGGDLITDQNGNVWLVAQVLEQWPGWAKCAVTLQDGA